MARNNFIRDERGATTIEWVVLCAAVTVLAGGVIYIIEGGMLDVPNQLTAVVERQVELPGGAAPDVSMGMRTPDFDGSVPTGNDANGIAFTAPTVNDSLGGGQVTHWLAQGMTNPEIIEGRARVSTLDDTDLMTLIAEYAPYRDTLPGSAEIERVMADKYHIALNEAEARGIQIADTAH